MSGCWIDRFPFRDSEGNIRVPKMSSEVASQLRRMAAELDDLQSRFAWTGMEFTCTDMSISDDGRRILSAKILVSGYPEASERLGTDTALASLATANELAKRLCARIIRLSLKPRAGELWDIVKGWLFRIALWLGI